MIDPAFRALIRRADVRALFWTQVLGMLNDNIYKMIVSLLVLGAAIGAGDAAQGATYLSLAGAIFALPYLVFSGYAGYLADAIDKRRVIIAAKIAEVAIMGLACAALILGSHNMLLALLFLMATQSVFFSAPPGMGSCRRFLRRKTCRRQTG